MESFTSPFGTFALERTPGRPSALRGWSAADEYVLSHLDTISAETALPEPIVVANPGAGAVAVALAAAGHQVGLLSDSFVDLAATRANAEANGVDLSLFTDVDLTDIDSAGVDSIGTVVVAVPKVIALLDAQLAAIAPALRTDSVVVGAGMTRNVHNSTIEMFERHIGPTPTSLAVKKARLLLATVDPERIGVAEQPVRATSFVARGMQIISEPTVFGAARLDAGTELLLDALPDLAEYRRSADAAVRVIDVGCGNGVIGTSIVLAQPQTQLTMIDESFAAVRSATATFHTNVPNPEFEPRIVAGDGLGTAADGIELEPGGTDVVVMNPPFHHDHAVTDEVAWSMFRGSRRVLRRGGAVIVVGNRHLGYHAQLKRLFGNCETIASNSKFVVLRATKR